MRGAFVDQGGLFSYIAPEARVPANHPLRKIRELVRGVLGELNRSLGRLYASEGRPSIPPEQLLSAQLLASPGLPVWPTTSRGLTEVTGELPSTQKSRRGNIGGNTRPAA